jgi:hypothetical protein
VDSRVDFNYFFIVKYIKGDDFMDIKAYGAAKGFTERFT